MQLLKRSKDYRAHHLRTILLLEADFNMNNKKLGREAMWNAERVGILALDNYGGRRGLQAAEVSMNQLLTYDSIWAHRGRAIVISNDAKGCYDRIAHLIVVLALRRLGIKKPPLQSMITTIQEMVHHIRTAFGDSASSYSSKPLCPPLQGVLQGNGSGPSGWSAIASVIIQAMRSKGFGYDTLSVISQRALTLVCFAFVDDADLIHANPDVPTAELLQEAQTMLSTWEGLLRATGGALAPEKSYWYLINVEWKAGRWSYSTIADDPGQLSLDSHGAPSPIRRLEVHQAQEALGIQMRPDRQMKDQVQHLRRRAMEWCDALRTKRLKKSEAWCCLNSTIMKTIEYPLMATTISKEDLQSIMRPILQTALPLCGYQKHLPRKLVHGSIQVQGSGVHDPWLTQIIKHVHAILRHCHRPTPSNNLHWENMELVQCYVGSKTPFWDLPYNIYGHLAPRGWMEFTWKALSETPLTLRGPDITVQPERQDDHYLMDSFVAMNFSPDQLSSLNDCRMYLQATLLSHICSADGTMIDPYCWHGRSHHARRVSNWPSARKPSVNAWTLWRSALRTTFLFPHALHRRLRHPLGPWLTLHDDNWIWWEDEQHSTLYEQ